MELEINYAELFRVLLKKLWIAVLAAVVFAVGMGFYTVNYVTPMYTSTSKLYVYNSSSTTVSVSDITTSGYLANDYMQFLYSSSIMESVAEQFDDFSPADIKRMVSVSNPSDTRVLTISTTATDPQIARRINNAVCNEFVDFVSELVSEGHVSIYDPATLPTAPSSPSVSRNILLGAFFGFAIPMLIVAVRFCLHNVITSAESVESALELKVIGKVPFSRSLASSDHGNRHES